MRVTVIPLVVDALERVPRGQEKTLRKSEIRE